MKNKILYGLRYTIFNFLLVFRRLLKIVLGILNFLLIALIIISFICYDSLSTTDRLIYVGTLIVSFLISTFYDLIVMKIKPDNIEVFLD